MDLKDLDLKGMAKEVADELAKLDRETQRRVVESVMGTEPKPDGMIVHTDSMPPVPSVLRPLKQGIIDTEKIAAYTRKVVFFWDNKKFALDESQKLPCHTNMTLCGQLGYPLMYDFRWLELHFDGDPEVCQKVLERSEFRFIFGGNTVYLRVPGSAWKPLVAMPKREMKKDDYDHIASVFLERGLFWGHYFHRFSDVGPPRRIDSTEAFRAEMSFYDLPQFPDPIHIKVSMHDTIYAHL